MSSILENAIIEVENETTDEEIKEIENAYPNSIVIRENCQFKELLYRVLKIKKINANI